MTKEKEIIAAISMDLKRASLAFYNGSEVVAATFSKEALTKIRSIKVELCAPYIQKIITSLPDILKQKDRKKVAEETLMYSTIFQNYALSK